MLSAEEKKQSKERGWEVGVGWGMTIDWEATQAPLRANHLEELKEGAPAYLEERFQQSMGVQHAFRV